MTQKLNIAMSRFISGKIPNAFEVYRLVNMK